MHRLSESYQLRFGGIARLYGAESLLHFSRAHFVVVGLGGVGSWVAEALARSGIGELTLIDMDDLCISNTNRQLPALSSTVGQLKTEALAARLKDINPEIKLNIVDDFLDKPNINEYILPCQHVVVDCIDAVLIKSNLVAYCSARKISMITVGSAGGKTDPRLVTSSDLSRTTSDPMLSKVRQQLFKFYNFSKDKNRKFRIEAVYSTEQAVYPKPDGSVCQQKSVSDGSVKLDCTTGFGSATMLTGTMGFVAAERALQRYLAKINKLSQAN
ncbi:MAG: tRNA cyclic N6-threonylcarbamoyladenosine(37) synthase TcdA [Sinobacterium sp.]|nr:tRNA cyclic N6-threonylcarbamoyladenosine(37) synthase TcdA [Sinobacterium sp.]